jgi:hypothetical protein
VVSAIADAADDPEIVRGFGIQTFPTLASGAWLAGSVRAIILSGH